MPKQYKICGRTSGKSVVVARAVADSLKKGDTVFLMMPGEAPARIVDVPGFMKNAG